MIRASQILTVKECEKALDQAIRELRALQGSSNLIAQSSIEYRIGTLRRRRADLMWQR